MLEPPGLDADTTDAGKGGVAHALVLDVRQRLGRRHGDRVARVHAHRVEVLDRADDDAVVEAIPHDLELEFLPAADGMLDEDLRHRARGEPGAGQARELLAVVGDPGALAAEDERRPDDDGVADLFGDGEGELEPDFEVGSLDAVEPTRFGAVTKPDAGTPSPISIMAALKRSRFSAVRMASALAPMSSTPKRSSTPRSDSSMARLRAV